MSCSGNKSFPATLKTIVLCDDSNLALSQWLLQSAIKSEDSGDIIPALSAAFVSRIKAKDGRVLSDISAPQRPWCGRDLSGAIQYSVPFVLLSFTDFLILLTRALRLPSRWKHLLSAPIITNSNFSFVIINSCSKKRLPCKKALYFCLLFITLLGSGTLQQCREKNKRSSEQRRDGEGAKRRDRWVLCTWYVECE